MPRSGSRAAPTPTAWPIVPQGALQLVQLLRLLAEKMMRRFASPLLALLGLGLWTSAQAAYDIDQLMSELATQKGGRARFVEKRHVALLDKPVQASGEMVFTRRTGWKSAPCCPSPRPWCWTRTR
jgi:hypothetical protein